MPKHICGADLGASMRALGFALRSRNLRRVADGSRCRETAVKTKRGAWRCPLHGGLSERPQDGGRQGPDLRCSSGALGSLP